MSNNILKESLNINKRNQKQKTQKEFNTALVKKPQNKRCINLISKLQKYNNDKKSKDDNTFRQKSKNCFFEKAQSYFNKTIKREKSADHFKKKPSLRRKIQLFFNEYGNYDTNNIVHNNNKKGKPNNKLISKKNYNTLILFKKNKGETLIEKKRKSYLSPEKSETQDKLNFYKRLLNIRSVSGSKLVTNFNNDNILFNRNENMKNNNYESNYINGYSKIYKNKINKKRKNKNNNKSKKNKNKNQQTKNFLNTLYKSQNLIKKVVVTPVKTNIKINKEKENNNLNVNNNILTKSVNLHIVSNNLNKNDIQNSHEKIQVNKNEENNLINTGKINVRKIDSLTNVNTNNSILLMFENKINKNEELCLTEENPNNNKNINDNNVNNIKVIKSKEFKNDENKKIKNFKRNKSCKKPFQNREALRENASAKKIRYKDKTKTPNKESLFNLKDFQNLLISNISNINNPNTEISYLYNIFYGSNGKLVEKVLKTRNNWEKIDSQSPQCANLIWTPLSCQINYKLHSNTENTQFVNHFEFHRELTNKANTFINLFRYCEFNDIDLFSFYPLTIILSSNLDYLQIQIEGFKRFYENISKFLYDINNLNNDENNNIKDNNNNINILQDKYYINYFNVNLSKKIGTRQKIQIPKSFYIGKNLWIIKRTNLNRGREMKLLSNVDDIITEINTTFENNNNTNKKQKLNNLIIQKYLESPLLYNGRKFDIRIWVLFTFLGKDNNYNVYVFKEGHLKACSDEFNINNDNLFIHLTNYSVQKHNVNFSKSEIGNEISFQMFQDELDRQKSGKNFKKDIFPEIIKIIWITAKAGKNKINIMERKNCFEIYGYDFILDTNYNPFLLEINTNPGLEESSPLIKMLVPRMIDDAFRLTIDKAFENGNKNPNDKNKSKFSVDGYTDEENMWQKIKKI